MAVISHHPTRAEVDAFVDKLREIMYLACKPGGKVECEMHRPPVEVHSDDPMFCGYRAGDYTHITVHVTEPAP